MFGPSWVSMSSHPGPRLAELSLPGVCHTHSAEWLRRTAEMSGTFQALCVYLAHSKVHVYPVHVARSKVNGRHVHSPLGAAVLRVGESAGAEGLGGPLPSSASSALAISLEHAPPQPSSLHPHRCPPEQATIVSSPWEKPSLLQST